jgi:hypothetical protein
MTIMLIRLTIIINSNVSQHIVPMPQPLCTTNPYQVIDHHKSR